MESESLKECRTLKNEITKGRDQVKRLKASSSGNEEIVLERMLASFEEALSILKGITSEGQCQSVLSSSSDTPGSSMALSNLQFEDSNIVSNPSQDNKSQRRIPVPKFTTRVKVTSQVTEPEALDDGYNWRKYGQKEILGCKFPRGYYRCTHRNSQGCKATKTMQRLENDRSIIEVAYSRKHTCDSLAPVSPPHGQAPVSPPHDQAPVSPPHGISLDLSNMESCTNN